jgi:hypothetical protein
MARSNLEREWIYGQTKSNEIKTTLKRSSGIATYLYCGQYPFRVWTWAGQRKEPAESFSLFSCSSKQGRHLLAQNI